MIFDRRSFLRASCVAAVGGALTPGAWAGAPKFSRVLTSALPLDPAEVKVLAFVATYATEIRLIGSGVLAKIRGTTPRTTHILAEIPDAGTVATALTSAPFSGIYAQDNSFYFSLGGIDFILENLVATAFADRLAQLSSRKSVAFAHDALSYDPSTQRLTDPFGAAKAGSLKLVNKTFGGAAALGVTLRGAEDAHDLGLARGADFAAWERRILRMITKASASDATVQAFLQELATLAGKLSPAEVEALLGSRAIATALQQVFGIDAATIIAEFQNQRPALDSSISNAAIWLALLLGPQIQSNFSDGAATNWIQRGNRFQVLRSRAALAQAGSLLF